MKKKINKRIRHIKHFLKNVLDILREPEMAILPGQLAFFVILSLVPVITLIGYGASFFNISIDSFVILLESMSPGLNKIVSPIITGSAMDFNLIIMIIIMFYLATNAADSIIIVSNEIYEIKQSSWLRRRIKAIIVTLALLLLIIFVLLVPVFGGKIINAIDYFNLKPTLSYILKVMQGPISWIIIFIFIKIIYTISPDRSQSSRRLNIGSLFTTIGWIITTEVYSYYINNFARYDLFYAGLSNIAGLMLWIYSLSYIFVIGMSLNSKVELEHTMY